MSGAAARYLVGLVLVTLGCGGGGTTNHGEEFPVEAPPKAVDPLAANVRGRFKTAAGDLPQGHFEVWLFDHTTSGLSRQQLGEHGSLVIPINAFSIDHDYSLHLVADFRVMGDIDMSSIVSGKQSLFHYSGGEGFDLGDVVVSTDKWGRLASQAPLVGAIGGGFSIVADGNGAFGAFPLPKWLSSAWFGSQLIVTNAEMLLKAFYGRETAPELYQREVRRSSRLAIEVHGAGSGQVAGAFVAEAGTWLVGARLPAGADPSPETAALWLQPGGGGAPLATKDQVTFTASVYAPDLSRLGEAAILRTVPADGGGGIMVPVQVPRLVSMPPQVLAVSGSGATPAAIAYGSAAADGLSKPICRTDALVIKVAMPLDENGQAIPATVLNRIDVMVEYFVMQNGRTVGMAASADQFSAPFNASVKDDTLPGISRSWDPATATARFDLGASATASLQPTIALWSQLFPATIKGQTVTNVRLSIVMKSTAEATAAGTLLWLANNCTP